MKVTYIALDPLKYPRIKKIAYTLKKRPDIQFHVMIPKIRFVSHGSRVKRVIYAVINYVAVILQTFFVKSDIFWVANCPDILVIPLVFRRKRYILEYRSPWSFEVKNEFGSGPWVRLAAMVENMALRYAWLVTLTTSKLLVKVKSFGKSVFVIPNYPLKDFGVDAVSRKEFRRRCGCCEDDKVVLFVGKLTHVEGVDLLPKIMMGVFKRTDAVFWVVGDGPLYPLLERFAKKFVGKVKLFGWRLHEEIPNFVVAADVCIAPRHRSPFYVFYNDENVQKLSEYMFFGKPIVACGIAESNEYLLVDQNEMADGVVKALNGQVAPSERKTWEDYCERKIIEMFSLIMSK